MSTRLKIWPKLLSLPSSSFVRCPSQQLDPQKTVFVGALHGMLNAEGLCTIFNDLFGGVVYASEFRIPSLSLLRLTIPCGFYPRTRVGLSIITSEPSTDDRISLCKVRVLRVILGPVLTELVVSLVSVVKILLLLPFFHVNSLFKSDLFGFLH